MNSITCSLLFVALLPLGVAGKEPVPEPGSITLPGCTFDRGNDNVRVDLAGISAVE